MTATNPPYRGRFAPTPSGPLHLGSLHTALASWLAARRAGGSWQLRIDDLDRPRCVPGAQDHILRQLEAHGLTWDGAVVLQSTHEAEYRAALQALAERDLVYACDCTRAVLAETQQPGPDGPIYTGTCRERALPLGTRSALRFRTASGEVGWQDNARGAVRRRIPGEAGDFVVRRADGQIAYHLACTMDEHRMQITEVVRGDDLLGSTVHQLQLFAALGFAAPRYTHVPVLIADDGRKLSKQNGAPAIGCDREAAQRQLFAGLQSLRLAPPAALRQEPVATLLRWALQQAHS